MAQVALAWQLSVSSPHSFTSAQVNPSPSYPVLHVQVMPPAVFAQVALGSQLALPVTHSSTLVQLVTPSPANPDLQLQRKLPAVLLHVALAWQLWVPRAHSSSLVQLTPSRQLWSYFVASYHLLKRMRRCF